MGLSGEIIVHRPARCGNAWGGTPIPGPEMVHCYIPFDEQRAARITPLQISNTGTGWAGFQANSVCVGPTRKLVREYHADGSYPGELAVSGFSAATKYNSRYWTTTGNASIQMTMPEAVKFVVVRGDYFSSFGTFNVAVNGDGTVVRESVNTGAGGPWEGGSNKKIPAYGVTIARDLSAGDVLTISVAAANTVRLYPIMLIGDHVDAGNVDEICIPSTLDIIPDDPAIDSDTVEYIYLDDGLGQSLAIYLADDYGYASYWGSPAHSNSTNRITGAGGTGDPPRTFRGLVLDGDSDDDYTDLATDLAVGEFGRYTQIMLATVGEALVNGAIVGTFRDGWLINASGANYSYGWGFNANAVTRGLRRKEDAYHTMCTLGVVTDDDSPPLATFVGTGICVPCTNVAEETLWPYLNSSAVVIHGGPLGSTALLWSPFPDVPLVAQRVLLKRTATGFIKLYCRHEQLTVDYDAIANGDVMAGGVWMLPHRYGGVVDRAGLGVGIGLGVGV